ncbi:MAG: tRNA pseudouridine(55) synthase TruB [Chitinophagales bacterium]|nr:tRNA pseudouridine(55) synthase TruB [Chitinophagales bacterium]
MKFTSAQFLSGEILLVDKPQNWTSFDVVNKLRYAISRKTGKLKVGHAGTLDPLATGLLIICTGKKTKELDNYQAQQKEYTGTLKLGATTPSFDAETEEINHQPFAGVTNAMIEDAVKQLTGTIEQTPPQFSAVKVDGKRAYDMARKDKTIEIPKRTITILAFEITRIELPYIDFRVQCSKGTYIRTLVNDFGVLLGCGAYMTALRRTKNGAFTIEDAWQLEALIKTIADIETVKQA